MADAKQVYELLAKAQSEMSNPKMNGHGQIGSRQYKYAELSEVLNVIRPALNKNGLFLLQRTVREGDGSLYISTCVCLGGDTFELDREYYTYDNDPQNFGKRETYARRYSLNKAFGLAGEDDNDAASVKAPSNPTGHALGNTVKPKATTEQRRKKMLARCADLAAKCIENGMNSGFAEAYMKAKYGADSMDGLTDEQIVEFGAYLKEMAEQSADLKARKEQA